MADSSKITDAPAGEQCPGCDGSGWAEITVYEWSDEHHETYEIQGIVVCPCGGHQ